MNTLIARGGLNSLDGFVRVNDLNIPASTGRDLDEAIKTLSSIRLNLEERDRQLAHLNSPKDDGLQ